MIIFDTETTGLIQHESTPLDRQPEIIEFCGIKVDDETLEERAVLTFLCRPRVLPLPDVITKITRLTDADVQAQPSWALTLPAVEDFFRGERVAVAHNCAYDIGMMTLELRRLGRVNRFPWPTVHLCTVEATRHLQGHRLKLGELYHLAFGETFPEAHRAEPDTRALVRVVRWLKSQELI